MIDYELINNSSYNIGITWWFDFDEIGNSIAVTLREMGHNIQIIQNGKEIPELDILLTYGPFGYITPIINQLAAMKPCRQPIFVFWLTEQLPNPILPEWFRYSVGAFFSKIERASFVSKNGIGWQIKPGGKWLLMKGWRYRYYGLIHWLQISGIRTILVTPSKITAEFLRTRGFDPVVACIRTLPWNISESSINRDIPVLWLGKTGSGRRKRILHHLRSELSGNGIEMMMVDGVENPYIFGEERTMILNRTKIALNLLRKPWDDNSLRFFYTADSHVLNVTEPLIPHSPFIPGTHIVEAPLDSLTETIRYYLSNDEERKKITDSAKQLVTNELTLEKSLSKILERVEGIYNAPCQG